MDTHLQESAQLLLNLEKQVTKAFQENNKLLKQGGVSLENASPVFISHCIFLKQYVVTYVRAYDDAVDEMYIEEFASMLSPSLFKKGVFIISNFKSIDQSFDPESTMNGSGPFNSSEIHPSEGTENNQMYFTNSVTFPVEVKEYVNCGTIFSASDVLAGGMKAFHGSLGLVKKVFLSIKELHLVSVIDAKLLCAMYAQCLNWSKNVKDLALMLIPCKASKPLNLTMISCHPEVSDGHQDVKLHVLETRNESTFRRNKHKNIEESTYLSTYDLLNNFKIETSDQELCDETSLKIEFHWSGSDSQPLQSPPPSAKTILQIQVTVGETRSAAHNIFLELTALSTIVNNTDPHSTMLLSASSSEKLDKKLSEFKESVSDFSFYGNNENNEKLAGEKTDDLVTAMSQLIQQSFQRNDQDFTDKLWIFLHQTEAIDDLRSYLDDILTDIVDGSLQPAISPTNETKLAKYIRRMYLAENDESKGHMKEKILEFLSSEQSIRNLIGEIGFEKMRKDYFSFFSSKELESTSNLQKLIKTNSPADLSVLWKLHYCLEIVITPAIYLNLAQDCQSSLLKAAIEYYSQHDISTSSPVFCLSLLPFHDSSTSVHQTCQAQHPITWQRGVISSNKAGFKETFILNVVSEDVLNEDDDTDVIGSKQEIKLLQEEVVTLPRGMAD